MDQEKFARSAWFRRDRFGLFVHWGLYAIPARGEWARGSEPIDDETYYGYFREFNPTGFDPRAWARAARAAGMKYAVLTAKHHDGFCLFDSAYTDFKATNTPCGRDLVREFLDAFRAEGLKVGLYYSLIDWNHPAYPAYHHHSHPHREDPAYRERRPFSEYLTYLHAQVEELATRYGKLDIMWFDYSYEDMRGEKWEATKLVRMLKSHQPHILIDNRLEASGEGFGSLATDHPREAAEMFHFAKSAENPLFAGFLIDTFTTTDKVLRYGESNKIDFSEHPTVVRRGSERTINLYAAVPDVA